MEHVYIDKCLGLSPLPPRCVIGIGVKFACQRGGWQKVWSPRWAKNGTPGNKNQEPGIKNREHGNGRKGIRRNAFVMPETCQRNVIPYRCQLFNAIPGWWGFDDGDGVGTQSGEVTTVSVLLGTFLQITLFTYNKPKCWSEKCRPKKWRKFEGKARCLEEYLSMSKEIWEYVSELKFLFVFEMTKFILRISFLSNEYNFYINNINKNINTWLVILSV